MSVAFLQSSPSNQCQFIRAFAISTGSFHLAPWWLGCRQRRVREQWRHSGRDVWLCIQAPSYRWSYGPHVGRPMPYSDTGVGHTLGDQPSVPRPLRPLRQRGADHRKRSVAQTASPWPLWGNCATLKPARSASDCRLASGFNQRVVTQDSRTDPEWMLFTDVRIFDISNRIE